VSPIAPPRTHAPSAGAARFRFNMTLLVLSGLLLAVLMSAHGMQEFQFGSEPEEDESLALSDTYVVLERPKGEVVLFLIGWLGVALAVVSLLVDGGRAAFGKLRQK